MKIVVVTNHGNAWVLEVDENTKHGGMNLHDTEHVVASYPYNNSEERV